MTWKRCYYWNSWGKLDGKLIRRFEMTSGRWRVIHRLACEALLVVAMIQVCLNAMECKNELPCSTWHHRVLPGDWMRARCRWLNETTHWERRQCDIKVRWWPMIWWHDERWYDDVMMTMRRNGGNNMISRWHFKRHFGGRISKSCLAYETSENTEYEHVNSLVNLWI